MGIIPGINELLLLTNLNKYYYANEYDVIIIDFIFVFEIIRLLSYPNLINYWLDKFNNTKFYLLKVLRPVSKLGGFDLPNDTVIKNSEILLKEIKLLQNWIVNHETTFRFVVTPNMKSVSFIKKAYMYLSMFSYNIDALIVNKILNEDKKHIDILKDIKDSFYPLPIVPIELKNQFNLDEITIDTDFNSILYKDRIYSINKINNQFYLKIKIDKIDDYNYKKVEDELIITYKDIKKSIYLPKILINRSIIDTYIEDDYLIVIFS